MDAHKPTSSKANAAPVVVASSSAVAPPRGAAPSSMKKDRKKTQWKRGKERELGVSGVEELVSVGPSEVLLPFMSCSLCSSTSGGEAYSCTSGHIVCVNCRPNVHACPFSIDVGGVDRALSVVPTCGAPYRSRTNPLYRAVYLNSRVPCDNPGCSATLRGKYISQHKRQCSFTTRMLCSWREECGSKGIPFGDAVKHLATHGLTLHTHASRTFTFKYDPNDGERGTVPRALLKFEDETFSLMTNRFEDSHFVFVSNLKATKDVKRNFHATVTLIGKHGTQMEWSGVVCGYGERGEMMKKAGCVNLQDDLLRRAFLHATRKGGRLFVVHVFLQLLGAASGVPVVEWVEEEPQWEEETLLWELWGGREEESTHVADLLSLAT